MPSTLSINAVSERFCHWPFASISNDRLKEGRRFLPILSARLRIPVAAFWLKKYLPGTSCVSMDSNNEHPTALLGDSEILAVKHTPRDTIPEFVQRLEYDGEIASSMTSEKPVDIFEDDGSWHTSSNEAHKLVKESRLLPSKPRSRPHSCQREVLAREPCCPDIGTRDICFFDIGDVSLSGDTRPVLLKDVYAKFFKFALKRDVEPGTL